MKKRKQFLVGASVLIAAALMIISSGSVGANTNSLSTIGKTSQIVTGQTSGTNTLQQGIVWDNGATVAGGNLYSSQNDTVYPFLSQTADDFIFDVETTITDFHFYGGFWNGNAFDPVDFQVYIYADDGTGNKPTGNGMPDPSGTALYSAFYPGVTGLPLDANGFYSYQVAINPPFVAQAGHKYWITPVSVFPYPPQWGWANTAGIQLHSSVQGFPFLGTNFWTDISPAVDMAFYLTGEESNQPKLELGNITGGFGIHCTLTNTGTAAATNVNWTITIDGGIILIPSGGKVTKSVASLAVDGSTAISTMVLGFGGILKPLNITVSAVASNASPVEKTVPAKIFLFFVKI